jgi:hypothetical protein
MVSCYAGDCFPYRMALFLSRRQYPSSLWGAPLLESPASPSEEISRLLQQAVDHARLASAQLAYQSTMLGFFQLVVLTGFG